jgi:hypothetical protein
MEKTNFNIPEFFYDLIAVLLPGIFTLGYIYFLFPEIFNVFVRLYPHLNNIFALLLISYILGQISYSLSSELIAPLFTVLSGNPIKTLLGKPIKNYQKRFNKYFLREVIEHDKYFVANVTKGIKKYTGNKKFDLDVGENIDIAYEFCRNFIIEKASRNYTTIRKEQAYGELSRSIILTSLIALLSLMFNGFSSKTVDHWWLKLVITILVLVSFIFRYGQVRYTAPIFIFSTFCTFLYLNQLKRKDNETF